MSQLINIWNYLSDTKELIGLSNAYDDALPAFCTTVEPPEKVPAGRRVYFNEETEKWEIKSALRTAVIPTLVYSYMDGTGEFIGTAMITGAIPANCTDIEPDVTVPDGSVLVFDADVQGWVAKEDHRGEVVYSTLTRESVAIDTLGPYPENTTPLPPDVPFALWNDTAWATDADAQRHSVINTNVKHYQRLMNRTLRSLCPLTTGRTLTADEQNTLTALQDFAAQIAAFIQAADLTDNALVFPEAAAGLLDYPYSLNPTYEAD